MKMIRAEQPLEPASSRILQKRWDTLKYKKHKKRVKEAVPTVDTRPPKEYLHVHLKLKKFQLEYERQCDIIRDNLTLLRRMSDAIHLQPSFNQQPASMKSAQIKSRKRNVGRNFGGTSKRCETSWQ